VAGQHFALIFERIHSYWKIKGQSYQDCPFLQLQTHNHLQLPWVRSVPIPKNPQSICHIGNEEGWSFQKLIAIHMRDWKITWKKRLKP
jgi:hypothetical protein